MTTKIYGCGNDLKFEGDVSSKVDRYSDNNGETLVACSDGTILIVKYGQPGLWPWIITPLNRGNLFDRIEWHTAESVDSYINDIAHFRDGLEWAYVGTQWKRISGEPTC